MNTSVLWIGGIAAFLGFMIGSYRPSGKFGNDEYAASKFNMLGATVWALIGATLAGGLAAYASAGEVIGLYAAAFGVILVGVRFLTMRGPSVPQNSDLADGVTRGQGASAKDKFKAVERLYKKASFHRDSYYATRSPLDWRFKEGGMPLDTLNMMAGSMQDVSENVFGILVLLVRELPGEPGEPAVIVVRGSENLRACKVVNGTITVPGYDQSIPATSIAGAVGYAWR